MKKLFQISSKDPGGLQEAMLCMRFGERYLSFVTVDRRSNIIHDLSYFGTEPGDLLEDLLDTQPGLKRDYSLVHIAFDYPQHVLLPADETSRVNSPALVTALYPPDEPSVILSDHLVEQNLVNTYWVPSRIHDWIKSHFHSAQIFHQHSVQYHTASGQTDTGLYVDFRNDSFSLMAVRDGVPLLFHNFEYATPGDVLYHLLKVCEQFGFNQQDVQLLVSGLVDRQSGLYQALYQYFIHVGFRISRWEIPPGQYPAHFFTSLNDLALCGS